ncbi:MAG: hypothetical protein HOQ22_17410 [Nocardioidaceae bacterium]|nr:hypothetical protein [Nocardioidaceae bacterium]NUS52802.1 hypothetical protein [Nocardioidaceae bacterium]
MTPTPALATLCHDPFFEPGWIYERKLDGERCLAVKRDGRTELRSRTGRDVTGSFPEVAEALDAQAADGFVLDGEVVAFDGPRTSFSRLQGRIQISDPQRARRTGIRVHHDVFDVLESDGEDRRDLPQRERKALLRAEWTGANQLRHPRYLGLRRDKAAKDVVRE